MTIAPGNYTGKIIDYGIRGLDSGKMLATVLFDIDGKQVSWSCGMESDKQRDFLVNMLKGMGWRDGAWERIDEIADGPASAALDEKRTFGLVVENNKRGYPEVSKLNMGLHGRMDRNAVRDRLKAGAVAGKPVDPDSIPF